MYSQQVESDPVNDFLEKICQSCFTQYGRIHTETSLSEDNHNEGCINKENVQNKAEACNHDHYSNDRREKYYVPFNISKNLNSCGRCLLCDEQKLSVSTDDTKPSVSAHEPKPSVSTQEPKPSTSYEEKKLSLSADEPKFSLSNYKPKPSMSTDESKPYTLCEDRKLSVSTDEPKHSVSNYKPKLSVSTTEPKPSTSYEERKLSVSTDKPKPSTSYEERKLSRENYVSTDKPKPSTSYEERKLSVSTDKPKPSTSYEERKLSVSTDKPKPSTSYEERKLSVSTDKPKPSTSYEERKLSVSTDKPKPSTSYEERKLSVSTDKPKPSTSYEERKLSVSTDKPKPSTSYEERKLSVSTDEPKPSTSYEERNSASFYESSRPANYNLDNWNNLCWSKKVIMQDRKNSQFSVPDMKNVVQDCENCEQKHALHNDQSEGYFPHNLCDANPVRAVGKWKRKFVDEPIPSTSGCPYEPDPSTSKSPFDQSSSASESFDEGSSSISNYATPRQLLENKNSCSKSDGAYSINFQGSPNFDCEPYSDIGSQEEESVKLNGTSSCKCFCHCDDSPSQDNYCSCHNLKMPEKSSSFADLDSITVSSQRKNLRVARTGLQQIAGLQMSKENLMHSCRQSARVMKQTCLQQEMSSPVRECQKDQRQPETNSGKGKHKDSQGRLFSQTYDKEMQTDNSAKPCQLELMKRHTCGVRLRVRAEYVDHTRALTGNIHSNKPELIDRQFEKFSQAYTILKSRDLVSIICDVRFSELIYLDAFWRDYVNGSLLEALKAVFITDTLRQAVGQEPIKLLVSVDEEDYEAGRLKLLQNMQD
ncbi:hypothetical protein CHS0354_019164 [Potamilus streckersoni]|uniref:TRADD-like N-terminal domain-containing protein n=1 Tax=Potamilus streckersoni TaxID=2493646 RepID=A0AAE0T0S1_9BIVA|nr:hypothetical protein CHS0354_019164 [Potamilus streckersoni]